VRPLGYRPDPAKQSHEKQDYPASARLKAEPLPTWHSNHRLVLNVLDQGVRSSCVENAIKQVVRMSHVHQGVANPPLGSRLFGYYLDRALAHEIDQDGGTFLRVAFENQNKFGICPESLWPYSDDDVTFKRMPSPEAFRAAYDQRAPTEYFRIYEEGNDRVTAVKRAVAAGFGVAFGTLVSDRFCAGNSGTEPLGPPTELSIAGGHAMAIVGYDGDVFDVVNSWSVEWGNRGYWKMTAEYLTWADTQDLWICQASPIFSEST